MMSTLTRVSAKTRILFLAILLILLPSAVLTYFGLQSMHEKAENLRANYRGTLKLLREKVEREVNRLEEPVRAILNQPPPKLHGPSELKSWLRGLESKNLGLRHPFLLNLSGGVISTSISSGWSKPERASEFDRTSSMADFQSAEALEFVKKDFPEALHHYNMALAKTASPSVRALLLCRIGRCFFKMERYKEGIEEYSKTLAIPNDEMSLGVPHSVTALSQIADGYAALKDPAKQGAALLGLYDSY